MAHRNLEPDLPFEFVVFGTPLSMQASAESKANWKARIESAARAALPPGSWLLTDPIAITIYIFPDGRLAGDLDNLIKPILDGKNRCVYDDDSLIERIVAQKFEPGAVFGFNNPSEVLSDALDAEPPVVYVRVTDDIHEELS